MTGQINSDLYWRATERNDSNALGALRETLDTAAKSHIIDHWKIPNTLPRDSILADAAAAFHRDLRGLEREAERMVSIYGPLVAEQPLFLAEYQSNLGLFHRTGLHVGAFQGADLLARIALPTHLLPGFGDYPTLRVARMREFGEAQLNELGEEFEREPNPYFVFEAFGIAQAYGLEPPDWVWENLTDMADRIRDLCDEPDVGGGSEAERVGKAVGFSTGGRGQTGWLERAGRLQRHKAIYVRMIEWLEEQIAQSSQTSQAQQRIC